MHSASETATRVAEQTRYAGRSAADYARMHPVQMAVLAGGVTWWLLRGRDTDDDTEYARGEERSLGDKAGEYVSSARETVGETWRRTSTTVDDWVHENPLAAGALAVAVGAAIGLSVRSTEFEDRTLGERRDQAMERARAKARELKAKVSDKVEKAVDDVAGIIATPSSTTTGASTPASSTIGSAS